MSLIGTRPQSLLEISRRVLDGADYASCMKEFIDEAARAAAVDRTSGEAILVLPPSFLEEEPLRIPDPVLRVHLAGMAEYISRLGAAPPPHWSESEDYFLPEATYTCGPNSRALFMAETPGAFRRRNLFCGRTAERLTRLLD
jgi:hypothetical protein